jgi:hypothetical protein
MKRSLFAIVAGALLSCSAASSFAGTYHFTPNPSDLYDLDHYKVYTWGINTPWDCEEEQICKVKLSFDCIRNWDDEANVLYVHLLDWAAKGVKVVDDDNQGEGDYFDGKGPELITYHNLPTYGQDLEYCFTDEEIAMLSDFAADGRFGLGFDPDCHFWNDGICLEIITCKIPTIPLPAAAGMFVPAAGLAGLVMRRMRKNAK